MRGLEDALARIARRDELRGRAGGAHRPDDTAPPTVNPVVDEVSEALRGVVERNPGVFATVVVQEAETAWSVWIGEWDGTLHTRVTKLDPDPPVGGASADSDVLDQPTKPLAVPRVGAPAAAGPATGPAAARSVSVSPAAEEAVIPLPRRRPSPPPASRADRVAPNLPAGSGRPAPIAEMLRPRNATTPPAGRDTLPARSLAEAETPPLGFRPPPIEPGALRPDNSPLADPDAPLPKRFPDTGIPLPRRRPALPPDRTTTRGAPLDRLPADPDDSTWPPPYRSSRLAERVGQRVDPQPAPAGATPALPGPAIPAPPLAAAQRVSGPAMNDRVAGRIAEMLRREAKRDNRGLTS